MELELRRGVEPELGRGVEPVLDVVEGAVDVSRSVAGIIDRVVVAVVVVLRVVVVVGRGGGGAVVGGGFVGSRRPEPGPDPLSAVPVTGPTRSAAETMISVPLAAAPVEARSTMFDCTLSVGVICPGSV